MDIYKTGQNFALCLKSHGYSVIKCASIIGVTRDAVYKWIRGEREISLTVAMLIEKRMGISPYEYVAMNETA